MALVEEYQHLINGQPEAYAPPPASSPQANEPMNVLSPEVSLSEGNSPIRVENQGKFLFQPAVNPLLTQLNKSNL